MVIARLIPFHFFHLLHNGRPTTACMLPQFKKKKEENVSSEKYVRKKLRARTRSIRTLYSFQFKNFPPLQSPHKLDQQFATFFLANRLHTISLFSIGNRKKKDKNKKKFRFLLYAKYLASVVVNEKHTTGHRANKQIEKINAKRKLWFFILLSFSFESCTYIFCLISICMQYHSVEEV